MGPQPMVEVTVTLLRYYKKFWVPETRSYGFKVLDISLKCISGNGNKNWGIYQKLNLPYVLSSSKSNDFIFFET